MRYDGVCGRWRKRQRSDCRTRRGLEGKTGGLWRRHPHHSSPVRRKPQGQAGVLRGAAKSQDRRVLRILLRQRQLPYLRQRQLWPRMAAAPGCPPETLEARLWRSTAARGLHGPPRQPLLYARCRCRSARNGGPPAAGERGGRQASARRARRAPARQGAALPTPPARAVPFIPPLEAVALVVIVSPVPAPEPSGFRHSRADGAADLTRGGGP